MLPDFGAYREDRPSDFYLAGDSELLSRADGVFVVEGSMLPVHTVLLKQRCGLFAGLKGHGCAAIGGAGIPLVYRDPAVGALDIVMSDQLPSGHPRSLEGFTLKRVAHFLRFLYHPSEVTVIDFHLPGAAKTLSACARLANALEVPQLLEELDARMEETVDSKAPTLQRLMDWAAVAEECGLTKLWTKCVREIAITLARGRKGLHPRATSRGNLLNGGAPPAVESVKAAALAGPDCTKTAVHDVALLRDLTPHTQLAVMATLLASLRKVPGDPSNLVPEEDSLVAALPELQPSPESPTNNEP